MSHGTATGPPAAVPWHVGWPCHSGPMRRRRVLTTHAIRAISVVSAISMVSAVAVLLPTGAALAAPNPAPGTRAAIAIAAEPLVRIDRSPGATVTFTGLDNRTSARVDWGDGSPTARSKGSCSVAKARRSPQACALTFNHSYSDVGTFTVTAAAAKARAGTALTVAPKPEPWRAAPGQVFTSWEPLGTRATYTPCQSIEWYFDTAGQPADRSTMRDDVVAGLATLSGITGLRFVEITDPNAAELTFSWRNLSDLGYADASAVGGFTGPNKGWVAFSPTNEWTNDYWAGNQPKAKQWREGNLLYTLSINGRQTLVVHEVMHALGFGHVEDFTSIMYPQSIGNGAGQLSAGDLEGLRTMYPSSPCPLIPD